jgi:hypothetical protein
LNRISQKSRVWAALAVSAAFLVPLGVLGGPALAKTAAAAAQYQYSSSSQYQYKVSICHRTHSKKHPWVQISVAASAAKAHLRHHDLAGNCAVSIASGKEEHHGKAKGKFKSGTAVPAPAPTVSGSDDDDQGTSDDSHGKSGESHGKSGDDHGNGKGHGH